jgi:flagellin-like hook-associated protein FlgL
MRRRISACLALVWLSIAVSPPPSHADSSSLNFLNRILGWNEGDTAKNVERLSSGRILLTDDPASYAINQTLEKYVRGLDRIMLNRTDMVSSYSVQDSYLAGIIEILQRIRDLAFQRAEGILSDSDRDLVDAEIGQQYDEIVFTLAQAEFNKKKIFGDLMESEIVRSNFKQGKYFQLDNIDSLLSFFIRRRAATGAKMQSLEFAIPGEAIARENMIGAQIHQDTDFTSEVSAFKKNQLLMLVNILMLEYTGP